MTKREFLINEAQLDGSLTTFHFNDTPLNWHAKFYPHKKYESARRSLAYYLRELIKEGVFHEPIRYGTGFLGKTDSGCTFTYTYHLVDHESTRRHFPELTIKSSNTVD